MPDQVLTKQVKVALLFGVLVALGFLVAALVTFIQKGDWPASYVSAGVGILAGMFIAIRRRARRR